MPPWAHDLKTSQRWRRTRLPLRPRDVHVARTVNHMTMETTMAPKTMRWIRTFRPSRRPSTRPS
eukprot:400283-Prymnesium_polylepis.1